MVQKRKESMKLRNTNPTNKSEVNYSVYIYMVLHMSRDKTYLFVFFSVFYLFYTFAILGIVLSNSLDFPKPIDITI
jgi:hypothetical protein